jgi:hypothetical protein
MAEEKKGAVQAAEEERGSIVGRSGDDGRPRTRDSHLCPLIIRDGSGSGLERISADFGYMVVGLVQIFTHGFADLDIRNNWVWGGFYISPADIRWSYEKLIPINPHKEL